MLRTIDFTPSVYEHAAALIGRTPLEVSRNAGLLFEAHKEAFRLYHHSPVVVGIDIYNLEAEAYGATVSTPSGSDIPAICVHPVAETCEIMKLRTLNPGADGPRPMVIETGRRLADQLPAADVRIPVSGPFSLAGNLIGFERLLQEILENPESVVEALLWLARGQILFCREVMEKGLEITFFESGATPPLISPELFSQVELPVLKYMIREVSKLAGHSVPCIIGGNTAPVVEFLMETGTGYVICPSETDQYLFMNKMEAYPEVLVRINMCPDGFASGDLQCVLNELDRVVKLAVFREKSCIGTGVLPFETDPTLVLRAKEHVKEVLFRNY